MVNPVSPRITMIVAVDNYGAVYVSFMQSNCNQDTFSLYLMNLVVQLDKDRPSWRRNTIIQIDGAPYHKTE